jgi:AcrR family transcriptional regulator
MTEHADRVDRGDRGNGVAGRLIDSARRLLEEEGLDAVTVRSVANGAGMSTMNVYSRFGGKDGLLDVLYREGFAALIDEIDEIDEPKLVDHLRAVAMTYRRFALAHAARYELMFGGDVRGFRPSDASLDLARSLLTRVTNRISAAVEGGDVSIPGGHSPDVTASSLWALCHGTLLFEHGGVADSMLDWSAAYDTGVSALIEQFFDSVGSRG